MAIDWLMLAVLILAVVAGFALGRRSRKKNPKRSVLLTFDQRCLSGLNHLLQDRAGDAVTELVDALEVSSETLDTHLALGALLRKQGEVAQAIAVHQRLLAATGLPLEQRREVQLELALNYVAAGLLDRAEALLLQLAGESEPDLKDRCLKVLIEVYQSEREWRKAIVMVDRIGAKSTLIAGVSLRQLKAHYCCELAEEAKSKQDLRLFRTLLSEASGYDKAGLRHTWLLAEFELEQGNAADAVKLIRRMITADSTVLPLLGEMLVACYRHLGRPLKLRSYLEELLQECVYAGSGAAFILALSRDIALCQGRQQAQDFLLWQLRCHGGLSILTEMLAEVESANAWDGIVESVAVLEDILAQEASYRCGGCGFSGNELHWLCPSCKSWSTFEWGARVAYPNRVQHVL